MDRRERDLRAMLRAILDGAGVDWTMEVTRKCQYLVRFTSLGGQPRQVIVSGTPSDWRALRNIEATLRRCLTA